MNCELDNAPTVADQIPAWYCPGCGKLEQIPVHGPSFNGYFLSTAMPNTHHHPGQGIYRLIPNAAAKRMAHTLRQRDIDHAREEAARRARAREFWADWDLP